MVQWLEDEVTLSGSIKITINKKEYERVLDRELKMIYQLYPVAVEHSYCVIPRQVFYTREFRERRFIQFPDCVLSVGRFEEMKRKNSLFGLSGDPDFTFGRFMNQDMIIPGNFLSTDAVVYRTIQLSTWDQLKTFNLSDINHRFNEASHTLEVLGHDPQYPVFCECWVKAPETKLFDDGWVQKWMGAKCKLQAAKSIGTFTTTMIGGVTVNYSIYTEEANNDINDCKDFFKSLRESNHFFVTVP